MTSIRPYLGSRILACNTLCEEGLGRSRGGDNGTHVWAELEVADTTRDVLAMRVVKMSVQDLFGERQRSVQPENPSVVRTAQKERYAPRADDLQIIFNALVIDEGALLEKGHGDFLVADSGGSGGHASGQALRSVGGIGRLGGEAVHRLRR